ncbi:MAG: site-specific DNA-methyltransferase (adenine-specific) [Psychroserpens sp.]|jgi:site-specific DNA-methyltransferase (adenine-specific)
MNFENGKLLIHGDCIEELKKIPDKAIDFVYLDLPYGQTACKWDVKLDHTALWVQLRRIAKSDRTPFFFSCTTKFGFELFNSAPKGWFRWDLVWKKNRAAGFLNAYRLPMRKHEMVYCFAKKCPAYDTSSHNEYKEEALQNVETFLYNKKDNYVKPKRHKNTLPTSDITQEEEPPSSWCHYPIDEKIDHRTAKPIKLMEFLLKYWTKEGDVVLDPTAGSGSMGVACKNMNRKFIGIEKDDKIFDLMKTRLK